MEWANKNGFEYVEKNEMGVCHFIDLVKGDLKIWCHDTEGAFEPRWLVNRMFQETHPTPDAALIEWNNKQSKPDPMVLDT